MRLPYNLDDIGKEILSLDEQRERLEDFAADKIDIKYNPLRESNIKTPLLNKPVFDYEYLNIEILPEYCFCKENLPKEVYTEYFKKVKDYSNKTISELKNIRHFKITTSPSKTEKLIYKKLVLKNENANIDIHEMPMMGHFALWTDDLNAPRVFFIVGRMALLNILLIDYDHSIHPKKIT